MNVPRLRMFAGPNGSGKTTVKYGLQRRPEWFGIYINPDELEKTLADHGTISLKPFGLVADEDELRAFFSTSQFLQDHKLATADFDVRGDVIDFRRLKMNSYYASVLADFLRRKAIDSGQSFSFETVMSSRDKVELLQRAQSLGFRTYLYYIATDDPQINVRRVRNRVIHGGHDVPVDKIISRYYRSLGLLADAVRNSNRAFFVDTSKESSWFFAEAIDGRSIELKSDEMPAWFENIWKQF